MNKTKIEWANYTWNPVTGCLHGCEYCYARSIAKRFGGNDGKFIRDYGENGIHEIDVETAWRNCPDRKDKVFPYPFGFEPTFHRYRLDEPQRVKTPQNVFVGSMGDMFGDWAPNEWIHQVFKACEKAPQHRYLFLTKNPKRYEKFDVYKPPNMWFGWSQTKPKEVASFDTHHSWQTFVSIEPLHEDFEKFYLNNIGWVIIGAETGNRKDKVIPEREWIENIVENCRLSNTPVFLKNNLAGIWGEPLIQEYPW